MGHSLGLEHSPHDQSRVANGRELAKYVVVVKLVEHCGLLRGEGGMF